MRPKSQQKIVLSNNKSHGEQGANKYIGYVGCTGIRLLHIIKNIYADHMDVVANDNELLKYIEIWNKTEALFNKNINKPVYNNEYINSKINPYNENFHSNRKLIQDKYYGHSILLLESICEIKNKYYPQTFIKVLFILRVF